LPAAAAFLDTLADPNSNRGFFEAARNSVVRRPRAGAGKRCSGSEFSESGPKSVSGSSFSVFLGRGLVRLGIGWFKLAQMLGKGSVDLEIARMLRNVAIAFVIGKRVALVAPESLGTRPRLVVFAVGLRVPRHGFN